MTNQKPRINQDEKLIEGYRGALVYSQEQVYKIITMTVTVLEGERSRVITNFYGLSAPEEPEHMPEVDLYHFPVADGTDIELTISSPAGETQAVLYTLLEDGIVEGPSSQIWLDIIESMSQGWSLLLPLDVEEAFYDALDYYKDQIPIWLAQFDLEPDTLLNDQADPSGK
jgi:hypothetical protein